MNEKINGTVADYRGENSQTRRVQERLLEMGKAIASVLDERHIPHFLTFGTLLGAVRHKGFIPWDDDFDFFLPDDTYEEAVRCLKEELPPDMFLEYFDTEPRYFHAWAHVKDINSRAVCDQFPQDGIYEHQGVYVDLYRIRKMDVNDVEDYKFREHIEYLKRKFRVGLIDENALAEQINAVKDRRKFTKEVMPKREVYALLSGADFIPCDEVFPLKRVHFEDTDFWGPNDSDSILRKFYGDYMSLPKEEDRRSHYSTVTFF